MDQAPLRDELLRRGFSPAVVDDLIVHWKWRVLDSESPEDFIDRYLPKPMKARGSDVGLSLRFRSEADRVKFLIKVRDLYMVRFDWPWREGEKFEDAKSLSVEFLEGT